MTSTAVRFHLRVLLCRQKYILTRAVGSRPAVHGACVATPKVRRKAAGSLRGAMVGVSRRSCGAMGAQCVTAAWTPNPQQPPLAGRPPTE